MSRSRKNRISNFSIAACLVLPLGLLVELSPGIGTAATSAPNVSVGADDIVGAGDGYVDLPIQLSSPSTQTVSVNYTTGGGSAVTAGYGGQIYYGVSGTATFTPGQTLQTVRVQLIDDTGVTTPVYFNFSLSAPANAAIVRPVQTVYIIPNGTPVATPSLYVRDATVDATAGTVQVPVMLGGAGTYDESSNSAITVQYATSDISAQAGTDYTTTKGTLTFPAGESVENISIPILDPSAAEPNRTFAVTLSNPTNATIADATGDVTIGASGGSPVATPNVSVGADDIVGAGDGYVDLPIQLSSPSTQTVSVNYTTGGGSAVTAGYGGQIYYGVSGTATFTPGQTLQTVRVQLIDDTGVTTPVYFNFSLSAPANAAIVRPVQTVYIIPNGTPVATPSLYVRDATVDATAGTVQVPVMLGGAGTYDESSNSAITVQYATSDISAQAGTDYTTTKGTLTFPAGESVENISIPILDPSAAEPNRTFAVTLSNPTNATIADATGDVTIGASGGSPVATPNVSVGADDIVGAGDGYVDLPIQLSSPSTQTVSVNYTTGGGSAVTAGYGGQIYYGVSGTATFTPGQTLQTVRVQLIDDTGVTTPVYFNFSLSAPANAAIVRPVQTVYIIPNGTPVATPSLYVRDATVDATAGTVQVPVMLGGAGTYDESSNSAITVQYATSDISAQAGTDYTTTKGTLTFPAGESVENISIPILDPSAAEPNRTFAVTLSNPTNATIADATGDVTIGASGGSPVATPNVSVGADDIVGAGDGYVDLPIQLSSPSTQTVSVNYTTGGGSAVTAGYGGQIYYGVSGTATFTPGQTLQTVRVQLIDDTGVTTPVYFNFSLSAPANAAIVDATEAVNIEPQSLVGIAGVVSGTVTYTLTGGTAQPLTSALLAFQSCTGDAQNLSCQDFEVTTDSAGNYRTSVPYGTFTITVYPGTSNSSGVQLNSASAAGALNADDPLAVENLDLQQTPFPSGVSVTGGRGTSNGEPVVYWASPTTVQVSGCSYGVGFVTSTVTSTVSGQLDTRVYPLIETPPGSGVYVATVPPLYPDHGDADFESDISCPDRTAVLPTDGPTTGGTTVTINGDGLEGTSTVLFGSTPATNVQVVNANTVTAVSPPGSGAVDITLEGTYGKISGSDLLQYNYLSVQSLSSSNGPTAGGNMILIEGTGLYHAVSVYFGANPAAYFLPISDTEMYAVAPPGSGAVDVRVLTGGGLSTVTTADPYTYSATAPTIAPPLVSTSPPVGPTDSTTGVTSGGNGSAGTDVATAPPGKIMSIDDADPALPPVDDPTTGPTPPLPDNTQATPDPLPLSGVPSGSTNSEDASPADAISALGLISDVTETIDNSYQAVVKGALCSCATYSKQLILEDAAQQMLANESDFLANSSAGYQNSLSVFLNRVSNLNSETASQLREADSLASRLGPAWGLFTTIPAGVDFSDMTRNIIALETYGAQQAGVTSPFALAGTALVSGVVGGISVGAGLTLCTLSIACGAGLFIMTTLASTAVKSCRSNPNSTSAICSGMIADLISAQNAYAQKLGLDPHKFWGEKIDPNGQVFDTAGAPVAGATATILGGSTSAGPFSAVAASSGLIEPASNPETTDSNGSFDWDAAPGWYEISASESGCTNPGNSSSTTVATAPFELPPPAIGLNLTLECPGLAPPPAPTVTSLSVNTGESAGGNIVDIEGSGFSPGSTVDFGSTPATSTTLLSSTTLQAVVPAGTGTVDVTVMSGGDTSSTSGSDGYSYLSVPVVSSLSAKSGPQSGGSPVDIFGTGFTANAEVYFGQIPAIAVTVSSPTEVQAIAPPGTGTVDVTVVTGGGGSATSSADQFTYTTSTSPSDHYSYAGGGGSGSAPASGSGLNGAIITLAANTFTYPGHTFAGWNDGTTTYAAGAEYTLSSDGAAIVFTARWAANATATITFNSEGGSAVASVMGLEGTKITLPAAPTYAGHTFHGWFVASSGGTALTSPYTLTASTTLYAHWSANAPPPPVTSPSTVSHGYWLDGSDGGIFGFGAAQFYGSTGSLILQRPVVGIVPTKDHGGYWLDASDGGVFSFGDTQFYGSVPGLGLHPAGSRLPNSLNAPIVAMVPSIDDNGYFMVASDGGVFAFGDAHFAGSCPGIGGCSGAAVAVMPDASGNGYWLVTQTGNVYTFGDAGAYGAPGNTGSPVTSAVSTPNGGGYWILTANGTLYNYGNAANFGDAAGAFGGFDPATAVFTTSDGGGYWIASANGTVDNYGDAPNDGGVSGTHLNGSIIAATGF